MFDRRLLANFDWVIFLLVLLISLIGVAAIYSASRGYPGEPQFWLRQLYWIGLGLLAGFVVLLVDFRTLGQLSYLLHGGVIAALGLLIVIDPGGDVDRWFHFGPVSIQPSEFAKFTTVLAVAYYFRDSRRVGSLGVWGLVGPVLMMAVPFALIVNQPDLGTALLLPLIVAPMLVLAGMRIRLMLATVVAGVVAIVALVASFQLGYYQLSDEAVRLLSRRGASSEVVSDVRALQEERYYLPTGLRNRLGSMLTLPSDSRLLDEVEQRSFHPYIGYLLRPYQQRRLLTFIDPDRDPLGAGYHIIQSKTAVGSGGLTGKGFGESTQGSLNFLPARHTDFVFSIFAEEWGFLGSFGLLALYLVLILRCLSIIFQTHDRFSAFVTVGVVAIIASQLFINTGMAMGLLPVVGVPMPFFSYGGSSMISMMIGIAVLLNIRMRRFLWA